MSEPNEAGTNPRLPARCEVGENANGWSQGIWVYVGDVLVWGHVSSEGPLDPQAESLLRALWPDRMHEWPNGSSDPEDRPMSDATNSPLVERLRSVLRAAGRIMSSGGLNLIFERASTLGKCDVVGCGCERFRPRASGSSDPEEET